MLRFECNLLLWELKGCCMDKVDKSAMWESLGARKKGLYLERALLVALADKRVESMPKAYDSLWRWMEEYLAAVILVPLVASMGMGWWAWFPVIDFSLVETGRLNLNAFALLPEFCFALWTSCACLYMASKKSWRARWAGPVECQEALSHAGRSELCEKWLEGAKRRGLRCGDVEAMQWIAKREDYLSMQQRIEASKQQDQSLRQKAFKEINQARLASLGEAREIGLVVKPLDAPQIKVRSKRI